VAGSTTAWAIQRAWAGKLVSYVVGPGVVLVCSRIDAANFAVETLRRGRFANMLVYVRAMHVLSTGQFVTQARRGQLPSSRMDTGK
jgi:hypothetical protein